MRNTEKSYLEIKVTFHHIVVLICGVILIGSFLFYLGYQAGKSSTKSQEHKAKFTNNEGSTKEIKLVKNKGSLSTKNSTQPSIKDEIKFHRQPAKKDSRGQKTTVKSAKKLTKESYYTIQVSSFNSHTLAKNYSRRFSTVGYPTSISQAKVKGIVWYRVMVGNFKTKEKAEKEKAELETLEKKKFIIIKSN